MQNKLKRLGDAELEIMLVIWRTGVPVTASTILEKLRGRRNWALSSLMTALSRLCEKGFVHCDRSTRTNLYSAVISERAYKEQEGRSFLKKLYGNSLQNFVMTLYDANAISEREIDELRTLFDELERQRNDG